MSDKKTDLKEKEWIARVLPDIGRLMTQPNLSALDLQQPKPKVPDIDLNAKRGMQTKDFDLERGKARIDWKEPGKATYVAGGYVLSGKELNAKVAPADCVLEYTPAAGTKLNAGTHTLTVRPKDAARYGAVEVQVKLVVDPIEARITLKPVAIDYVPGLTLSEGHFNASVEPDGLKLELLPKPGTALNAVTWKLSADLANDPVNANYVCKQPPQEDLLVRRAKAKLELKDPPAAVRYVEGGYVLAKEDFIAASDPPDLELVYTPPLGDKLSVGDAKLSVALADKGRAANYECVAPPPVTLKVDKGLAKVTLTEPDAVEWVEGGFNLTKAQFGAVVQPSGLDLTYDPPLDTKLPSGPKPRELAVSLVNDLWELDAPPKPVKLQANPAKATITWPRTPGPVVFQAPKGFKLTANELCATVVPGHLKLVFERWGRRVKPGDELEVDTHELVAKLSDDPVNEHYVAVSEPSVNLVVNRLAFVISAPTAATKVDPVDGFYKLDIMDLKITTKPRVALDVLETDPKAGSLLEPSTSKPYTITVRLSDDENYQADAATATLRVTAPKSKSKLGTATKPTKPVINPVEYPTGQSRGSILNLATDGLTKKQLNNRLTDLETWTVRAEDHGYNLKPNVDYHCKFLDMTCGMLFAYREETNGSITPILRDVAFARASGNKYVGTFVTNWW